MKNKNTKIGSDTNTAIAKQRTAERRKRTTGNRERQRAPSETTASILVRVSQKENFG